MSITASMMIQDQEDGMVDLVYLLLVTGFFLVCFGLAAALEKLKE
jgi:hypothetical protein